MARKVERYETSDLEDRHKAALRVADALMTSPGGIGDDLRAEVRRHFSDREIVELTLAVMKWNYQKVLVALGADAEVAPGRITDLSFDDDGNPRY